LILNHYLPANATPRWKLPEIVKHYPYLSAAARRLLSAHVTTAAAERNWSAWGRTFVPSRSSLKITTAEKLIYIAGNSKESSSSTDFEVYLTTLASMTDEQ
jgi:hypothetical protein